MHWSVTDSSPQPNIVDRMAERDRILRAALERLATPGCGAVSVPFLDPTEIEPLLQEARRLPYRQARPIVGEGEKAVTQDFELSEALPPKGAVAAFARCLQARLLGLTGNWFAPGFVLNDLIAQRYPAGSRGITPHRDHLRYRNLVVLLTLVGQGRLFLCKDRSGTSPQQVNITPGHLALMRAPGFAGQEDRPFHFLTDITSERISIGLRHDTRRQAGSS